MYHTIIPIWYVFKHKNTNEKKAGVLVILLAFGLTLVFLGITVLYKPSLPTDTMTIVSPLPTLQVISMARTSLPPPPGQLKHTIENALEGTKGTYGVVIKHLKTGESYSANENNIFEPGSLYKIWIMATAFDQIQHGLLADDERLSQDITHLNDEFHIASESAELTEGVASFTVSDALEQMITISHNYAALLLSDKIRLSSVSTFLGNHGFTKSSLGEPPKTTPSDIALFFEKLYKGTLANQDYTHKMISLLKKQTLNSKIPKYLPTTVSIAHKTGEIGSYSHDAGIVYGANGEYIIVVLSDSNYPPDAEERIAAVSKAVYDYFEKK